MNAIKIRFNFKTPPSHIGAALISQDQEVVLVLTPTQRKHLEGLNTQTERQWIINRWAEGTLNWMTDHGAAYQIKGIRAVHLATIATAK